MKLFIFFLLILVCLYLIYDWLKISRPPKGSIKDDPKVIFPITLAEKSFNVAVYDQPIATLPVIRGGWSSINSDQKILHNYADELNSHWQAVENAASMAINRFETDHRQLLDQQLQIHRRIFRHRKVLAQFEELKRNKLSSKDIPDIFRVTIPLKPSYPKPNELQRKYSLDKYVTSAGGAVGKLAGQYGGLRKPQNVLVIVAIVGFGVIKAKSNNSKLKRVLEDTRGQIANYSIAVKSTVAILALHHPRIVEVSAQLKKCEAILLDLENKVKTIDTKIRRLDQVPADVQQYLQLLDILLINAEQYSKKSI
jgi:hypothetical protein